MPGLVRVCRELVILFGVLRSVRVLFFFFFFFMILLLLLLYTALAFYKLCKM